MLSAKDVMTHHPVTIHQEDTLEVAAHLLIEHAISGLPVIDDAGHVVGFITEYELLDLLKHPAAAREPVGRHMTDCVITVETDVTVERVIDILREHRIRRVPVVERGILVGVIARRDVLRSGCARVERTREQAWLSTLLAGSLSTRCR
ncbi:MAG: CBS domain-containing protein [Pirellulales bacterium]|nr:CBS domain-containing protein [Pirellulales bacterium]